MPPWDSTEQKTEKPTPRKRERAREQGVVAQSSEVNNFLVLAAGFGALALFGGRTFHALADEMTKRLGGLSSPAITMEGTVVLVRESLRSIAGAVMPIVVLVGAVGLLCSLAQTGFLFTTKGLIPDLNAINPVKGLKNLFSMSALVRLLAAGVKLALIGGIAFFLLRDRMTWILSLMGQSVSVVLAGGKQLCFSLMSRILVGMLGVAVADYAFQRWRFEKQIMMSRTEYKEERKRDEGRPEVKARMALIRREMARSRMMHAVPSADVVVTNPTHIAVALKWDEKKMTAPQVVAKGRNYLAERIKQVAREHGVPVLERKLLAQTLYAAVDIGREIPPKLYYAVAQVLAFVMKKRN